MQLWVGMCVKSFSGFVPLWLTFESSTWASAWGEIRCIPTFYRNPGGLMKWGHQWESAQSWEDVLSLLSFWIHYPILRACHPIFSSWMSFLLNLIFFNMFCIPAPHRGVALCHLCFCWFAVSLFPHPLKLGWNKSFQYSVVKKMSWSP